MKKLLFKFYVISSSILVLSNPVASEIIIPSGTKVYFDRSLGTTSYFEDNSGIGNSHGEKFNSDHKCENSRISDLYVTGNRSQIIANYACINQLIKSGSNSTIELAPNLDGAAIEIGAGENPTRISNEGISVGGNPLITKKDNGEIHLGKNSWITKEENGRQKVYAKDAAGNSIPIDYTNGTKLLINGRDVEQSINNIGALSAALTGLPTVPTDTTLACGLGTGTHGGDFAFSGGCASKVNDKLSVNYAASMTMPGQDYVGDFEDTFSARAGFVWKLGKSAKPTQISMKAKEKMEEKILSLEEINNKIISQNKDLKQQNKSIISKNQNLENKVSTLMARLERLEKIALSETTSKDVAVYKLK